MRHETKRKKKKKFCYKITPSRKKTAKPDPEGKSVTSSLEKVKKKKKNQDASD